MMIQASEANININDFDLDVVYGYFVIVAVELELLLLRSSKNSTIIMYNVARVSNLCEIPERERERSQRRDREFRLACAFFPQSAT